MGATANDSRIRAEGDGFAPIKNREGSLPESGVPERFTVANDAALHLVHLTKATLDHHGRENFAPNAPGAVGDHRLIFEVIVFAAV